MRTEDDLRVAFEALADAAPPESDVLPQLTLADTPTRPRRRLTPILATVAAMLAVVAGTAVVLDRHGPRTSTAAAAACAPAAGDLTRFRLDRIDGLAPFTAWAAGCGRRDIAALSAAGGVWGYLTVYEPGAFDPKAYTGKPVRVAGHRGFVAQMERPQGRLVPTGGRYGVAWEYTPGAWAAVTGLQQNAEAQLPLIQKLAAALHPEFRDPLLVPMRLSYLPPGLRLTYAEAATNASTGLFTCRPEGYSPEPTCVFDLMGTYGCPPDLAVTIQEPNQADLARGQRIEVNGHPAALVAAGQSGFPVPTTEVVVVEGRWTVTVLASGTTWRLPDDELIRIAAGVVPAASVTKLSTWFDARDALPN
jgi:hypothetical protein